jgi:hypothetical protein
MTPAAQLVADFRAAAARLRQVVLHPPGGTAAGQAFRQGRAAEQLRQVEAVVRQLTADSGQWAQAQVPAGYYQGIRQAIRQARAAGVRDGGALLRGGFSLLDPRAVEALAAEPARRQAQAAAGDLARAAASMGDTAGRVIRATAQNALGEGEINRILAGGIIEGTPAPTIRALREEFRRAADDDFIEVPTRSGGTMRFEVGHYARMVAITRTREAMEIGRHRRLGEVGIDLVRIVGRMSNNFCSAFLDQVFSLSGRHPRYPALSSLPGGGPPFHPNCSKSTGAFVEALANEDQRDASEQTADTRTLIGMSAAQAQRAYQDLQLRAQSEPRHQRVVASLTGA